MSTELTIILDSDPEAITADCKHQITVAARAIAVSLGVQGLSSNFEERKTELLATYAGYTVPPTTDDEQTDMLSMQRALASFRIEATKEEDLMKRPLNTAKAKIIEIVKAGIAPIEAAEKKLQGFINFRQNKLAEERRAEEQRVQREREETERQRLQALREQEEAERKRQQAELARQRAEAANSPEAKLKAQQEQKRLSDEAAKLEADAYEKELTAAMTPAPVPVGAPSPQAREVYEFTLNGHNEFAKGESLRRLFAQHPEFFATHVKEEAPREFTIKLKVKDLLDALEGRPPFQKLESAHGITISTRFATLR